MINKIFDSTRTQTFSDCPKKYEWEYRTAGQGIVSREKNEHLLLGIGVADASEGLIAGLSLNEVLPKLEVHTRQIPGETGDGLPKSDEYTRLGMGLLYSLELYLPIFKEKYNILGTETELVIPLRYDIVWLTRTDIIVEHRSDGAKFNINTKTTSRPDKLFSYYEYALQPQMEAYSVQIHLQSVVSGTILLSLNKGSEREGRRISPFTYVYAKNEPGRGRLVNYGYKAGWTRTPTWTNNIPLPPPEIALATVSETDTIPLRMPMVEAVQDDLLYISEQKHFPRNLSNCNNDGGYGSKCPYIKLCHEGEKWYENLDLYQIREPNHPIESTLLQQE